MDLAYLGLKSVGEIKRNLPLSELVEMAVQRGEGQLGMKGALMVDTGKYTGRSPNDRFVVDEPSTRDHIWWGDVNRPVSVEVFDHLYEQVINYYNSNDGGLGVLVFDGFSGAEENTSMPVRFLAKKAWQAIFVNNMFIRPTDGQLTDFLPRFTIINASAVVDEEWKAHGLDSETFILFHLGRGIAIIGGTEYGGEMKKGIFSIMNFRLPLKGILTMHCAANVDMDGRNSALFFGLSGTGKTTLSTDPNRLLIGDDEHGWSDDGIFNLEGGCYAKAINLSKEAEPGIWNAIGHGALLENVVYDGASLKVNFSDGSKTENTRICYPLDHIEASVYATGKPSRAGHPENIIFLSCDAYGVLPPVARLNPEQAMYHFISGYTAKVAGTERGVTEPQATFSPCFGGPFLMLHPLKYAKLLKEKMEEYKTNVFLVNTGWSGGTASSGASRMPLGETRKMITAILSGSIQNSSFENEPVFGLEIPTEILGVNSKILMPRNAWTDCGEYDHVASELVAKFKENFDKYRNDEASFGVGGPVL